MCCTCSLVSRLGHRRLPSSRTSTCYKNSVFLNAHTCTTFNRGSRKLFRCKLLNYLLQKTFKVNFSHMKPPTLNSSACDWWMRKLSFWRPFVFCFIFHQTLWQILAWTGVQMKAFMSAPLCCGCRPSGCLPVLLPRLLPEQNRTEHCTLLEQHSFCHCTLMDRWWLRPSAQPDGDTEGNWGGGGGVHLTFETADGCAKESEDIQLIKLKLQWVKRCRMGGDVR